MNEHIPIHTVQKTHNSQTPHTTLDIPRSQIPDFVEVNPAEANAYVMNAGHRAEEQEEDCHGVEDVVQGEQGLAEHQHEVHRVRQRRVLTTRQRTGIPYMGHRKKCSPVTSAGSVFLYGAISFWRLRDSSLASILWPLNSIQPFLCMRNMRSPCS